MGNLKRTICALMIMLLAPVVSYGLTADEHRKAGIKYMTQGKIDEAIAEFKKAIEVDGTYKRARQVKNSLEIAQKVLRGNIKKEAAIYLFKAVDYTDKGMVDEGITQCKRALEIEPNWADAYTLLGFAYCSKGLVDQGIAELEKAVKIEPNSAYPHLALGVAYMEKGTLDQGIAELEKAVKIEPNFTEAHAALETARLSKSIEGTKQSEKKPELLKPQYAYDPTGKPDPFKPLTFRPEIAPHLTPLQRLEVTQLTLVGILWDDKVARAMVQDPSGKGYILTKGTLVGTKGGYVKQILKNKVIIEEKTEDLIGRVKVTEVELALRKYVEEEEL